MQVFTCINQHENADLHLESEVLQILLDLFFKVVAFREHLGEFAGEAGHFLLEGFVVLHGVFDADVTAWGEDIVLLGNVCGFDYDTEAFFVLEFAFLLFAAAYEPERDGDGDAVEELGGHGDYAFDEVRLDDAFADFAFTAGLGAESAVRKDEPDFSAGREVVNHVFDPREVRVACGREAVLPARVFLQLFLAPVLEVEGRVSHNEVKALVGVQVVEKRICVVFAEIRVDAADGHVHFCHFPGVGVGLLSVNAYIVAVTAVILYELDALHEHAAGTTAGVIDALAFARFEDAHDGFHDACRGVEFASLDAFVACELRDAVFVGTAE